MPGKDERLKPGSAGHQVPPMVPSGPGSAYPRPMYQVPLLSHLPMGRPPPPQLHPSVVQRMLAQGIQPQPLGPALMQSGWLDFLSCSLFLLDLMAPLEHFSVSLI